MIRMLELNGNAVQWNNLRLRRNPFLSEWDSELKTKSSQFVQPGEPTAIARFATHLNRKTVLLFQVCAPTKARPGVNPRRNRGFLEFA